MEFIILVIIIVFLIFIAELFCNGLEHFGEMLHISDNLTGSIFAAVATAMPETLIPLLALLIPSHDKLHSTSQEIGYGAIFGAPLMLLTFSLFIMAVFIIKQRGISGVLTPKYDAIKRDLKVFLINYLIVIIYLFIPLNIRFRGLDIIVTLIIITNYILYIYQVTKSSSKDVAEGHGTSSTSKLWLSYILRKKNLFIVIIQLIVSFVGLIIAAKLFISVINELATIYHISVFLFSFFIIPIATEFPEKLNSVIWLFKKKDTLAIGNISGALTYHASILPILIFFTSNLDLSGNLLLMSGIIITIVATVWFYCVIKFIAPKFNGIPLWSFLINGLLYIVNIATCTVLYYYH